MTTVSTEAGRCAAPIFRPVPGTTQPATPRRIIAEAAAAPAPDLLDSKDIPSEQARGLLTFKESHSRGVLNFKDTPLLAFEKAPGDLSRTPLRGARDRLRNFAETPDPIQIHARAVNSLTMALHYLRQPESNVPGASRKAVQALAAINALRFVGRGEAANDGRA